MSETISAVRFAAAGKPPELNHPVTITILDSART